MSDFITDIRNKDKWEKKFKKIELILNKWKKRNLTLTGKKLVMNTLFISNFIDVLIQSNLEKDDVNQLVKMIKDFIHRRGLNIPYKILIQSIEKGG